MSDLTAHYPTWEWYIREYPGRAHASTWYRYILAGLREVCRVQIDPAMDRLSRSQEVDQYTVIDLYAPGGVVRTVYDWSDFDWSSPGKHGEAAYFKIQCRAGSGMRPIGQTVAGMGMLPMLPGLRARADAKTFDVLCLGRATNFALRTDAVRLLRSRPEWTQVTGVSPFPRRPEIPPDVAAPRIPWKRNLILTAQARVVVALPGVGGDWTWRHGETLAIGSCLVCPEGPYLAPGAAAGCWATCRRDLSDLLDVVGELLADPARREAIAARGREYWGRELTPAAMARRLITEATNGTHPDQ